MRTTKEEYFSIIENFIDSYKERYGSVPTIYEMADTLNIPKSTVSRYLNYMRDHDMIEFSGRRSIITRAAKKTHLESTLVPVLGIVSCGVPKLAEENVEEYVRLPISLFGSGNFFLLRANGSSMIDAGIHHGDLVLIRQQSSADAGQIVVALIGDEEATLKRFYPDYEAGIIRLHPENSAMNDIIVESCVIQGVAVNVIKDLL